MFESSGHIYVYFTYGMHYCLNIVTGERGEGEAVLIRAGEPITGIEIMKKNRGMADDKNLTNGPSKVAQALGIFDTSLSGKILNPKGKYLTSQVFPTGQASQAKSRSLRRLTSQYADIFLEPPTEKIDKKSIIVGPRVGITRATNELWRFYIKDNPFVSKL